MTAAGARLALGTVQFGQAYGVANTSGQPPEEEIAEILDLARTGGIDTIDTAIAYGTAELRLGRCGLSGFRVVSKLPPLPRGTHDVTSWAVAQTEGALERLGLDALDGLLLHAPDQLSGVQGPALVTALSAVCDRGLARRVGASVYGIEDLETVSAMMDATLAQMPANVLSDLESPRIGRVVAAGCAVHARSVFLQGLLAMRQPWTDRRFTSHRAILETWSRWLVDNELSAVEACLRHVLAQSVFERVVLGVETAAQLAELLAVPTDPLPRLPEWPETPPVELLNPALWSAR